MQQKCVTALHTVLYKQVKHWKDEKKPIANKNMINDVKTDGDKVYCTKK